MMQTAEALARTSLLINQELFGGDADELLISAALPEGCIELKGSRESLSTRAGQTALVTAFVANLFGETSPGVWTVLLVTVAMVMVVDTNCGWSCPQTTFTSKETRCV